MCFLHDRRWHFGRVPAWYDRPQSTNGEDDNEAHDIKQNRVRGWRHRG